MLYKHQLEARGEMAKTNKNTSITCLSSIGERNIAKACEDYEMLGSQEGRREKWKQDISNTLFAFFP